MVALSTYSFVITAISRDDTAENRSMFLEFVMLTVYDLIQQGIYPVVWKDNILIPKELVVAFGILAMEENEPSDDWKAVDCIKWWQCIQFIINVPHKTYRGTFYQ
eukprot:6189049-Ditylum_brightwellii.AAC.1